MSKKKRSGTPSVASSTPRLLEGFSLYLDESVDGETLAAALVAAHIKVERATRNFSRGTPDEVWLPEVGRRGWIVLTRDKRIRYRTLERVALTAAAVRAFVFTGGNVGAKETAAILVQACRAIDRICRAEQPPFIYHIGLSGKPVRMQ